MTQCWIYGGVLWPSGYGAMYWGGKTVGAHRAAWEMANGPIPGGLHVLHACDVRACVNVEHLFLGTNQDNVDDKQAKGRTPSGQNAPNSKLRTRDVRWARRVLAEPNPPFQREVAEALGISYAHMCNIARGKEWGRYLSGA